MSFLYQKNLNLKYLITALVLALVSIVPVSPVSAVVSAEERAALTCTDFKFVFARGSGSEVNSDRDFKPFKAAVNQVFAAGGFTYSFYELGSLPKAWGGHSYPAPGIGISSWERFDTSIGALLSGGEVGTYGESVEEGAAEATTYLFTLRGACPNTKVVLAGYSQGAQVVSRTLQLAEPNWIFAALTFGDPKLYLPEGKYEYLANTTAACRNEKLSEYRAYVPDCYAYQGILGGYKPYQPSSDYSGKLKAYCQFHDVICSAYIDLDNLVYGHASYNEQGTYARAIQDVYNMVRPATYSRPSQNVAILFDNTGSMGPLLAQFKDEAIRTARTTLLRGGKVALYTYGDLEDSKPTELCNFETCSESNVASLISNITVDGGGDTPESLLSASYSIMRRLNWEIGANKSLVVLTDANYHNPDRDGITLDEVVELSENIDPVNFYILTIPEYADSYSELATRTNGGVYTNDLASAFGDIETEIISRDPGAIYTSTTLPAPSFATLSNLALTKTSDSSVRVSFSTDGVMTFIAIDDVVLGYTEETSFEITDLDLNRENVICLAPVSDSGFRSSSTCVSTLTATLPVIPKAPNTGKSK
ncbi:cutinase family protein [Candidatus Saccharibacteria bacterium]|nr:cutinase family protein [Candidatus Saccharibacteria bacterium]